MILELCELARVAGVPVMVMIRPRGGDFVDSPDEVEVEVMVADLRAVRRIGPAGYVLGCLSAKGWVDADLTRQLVAEAGGKVVTFHRALDFAVDPVASAEVAFKAGCTRVLTAGGARTALEGAAVIRRIVSRAPSPAAVVVAGGIKTTSVAEIVRQTGVGGVLTSARTAAAPAARTMQQPPVGVVPDWPVAAWPIPDRAKIQALRAAVS